MNQKSLNPLVATDHIRKTYLRYLKTTFPILDPDLRLDFWEALNEAELLVKGPILEATSEFVPGRSIDQLVNQGVLSKEFKRICSSALPLERPLYFHQDEAIQKVVLHRRNVVVATGTGSGKTEAFLIPILNHLLNERKSGTLQEPGIRALLLYPMNALANDQLKRLRKILQMVPDITFGRYIGETERTYEAAAAKFHTQFPGERLLPTELISREQMQATPPHILLTNYAMLEYLLLRPADTTFFDGPTARHWQFLVLDETHVYDGAQGIEIGMLLRRLKDRVVQSEPGRLQIIATSATLGRGKEDYPDVVRFASNSSGEEFEWNSDDPIRQDVVESKRIAFNISDEGWQETDPELFLELRNLINQTEITEISCRNLSKLSRKFGVPEPILLDAEKNSISASGSEQINLYLYWLLKNNIHLIRLHQSLASSPRLLSQISPEIFTNDDRGPEHLVAFIDLAVRARKDPFSSSLLPARYHVFAKALEGAFGCLNAKAHQTLEKPRIFLKRYEICPHCGKHVYELSVCSRCGTIYIHGLINEENGRKTLIETGNNQNEIRLKPIVFVLSDRIEIPDEDEIVAEEIDFDESIEEVEERDPWTLCLGCGTIIQGDNLPTGCGCPSGTPRVVLDRVDSEGTKELNHCVICDGRSSAGIIRRVLTGQDAPVSVLATALYQLLPPSPEDKDEILPGQGRKLLVFSDSRQDAAFFAPYMEQTYSQILQRRLMWKTLSENEDAVSGRLRLKDLISRLLNYAESAYFFNESDSYDERRSRLMLWLIQELVTTDRWIGLEGLGLAQFRLVKPDRWRAPEVLMQAPWNLKSEDAWKLVAQLLDTLRIQSAILFPSNVDPENEVFAPRNREFFVRQSTPDSKKCVFSWLPKRGSNRRLDLLVKLIEKIDPSLSGEQKRSISIDALTHIWELMTQGPEWSKYLVKKTLPGTGPVFQLSHEFWEINPAPITQTPVYACPKCRAITYTNLRGICPTYRCHGELVLADFDTQDWQDNHYRNLYQTLDLIALAAQEHTAQWTAESATEKQQNFIDGEINLLSCSTTFELGVDVGELQSVLMRNMPPTTANYIQRAGRAGRRTDSAAFALTYAQRRSHDLMYYNHPEQMVAGKIRPPSVQIENEKIVRRHVYAVIVASFFRWAVDLNGSLFKTAGSFFSSKSGERSGYEFFLQYIQEKPEKVRQALLRLVPSNLHGDLGIENWGWLSSLANPGVENYSEKGVMDKASDEVICDLEEIHALEVQAARESRYTVAEHFKRVSETISNREILGFFGAHNILPKYGFPTDVVELRTNHLHTPEAQQVELTRDLRLAIAEYAPGSEVIAAKRVWVSAGIHKPPTQDWQTYNYTICSGCKRLIFSMKDLEDHCPICGRSLADRDSNRERKFIIPEFGFLVSRDEPKKPGTSRPNRVYASQVYFAEYRLPGSEEQIEVPLEEVPAVSRNGIHVSKRYSKYTWLAVINNGRFNRGYRVCKYCGFGELAEFPDNERRGVRTAHKNPLTGKDCNGYRETVSLGHKFMTDALEIRFLGYLAHNEASDKMWLSVLYAILEGASSALGIRRDDLDGTLYYYDTSFTPALMLFDNVPGGAGHVHRIGDHLEETLQAALEKVSQECCGPETSCFECLRNFRNQMVHNQLERGLAKGFLEKIFTK